MVHSGEYTPYIVLHSTWLLCRCDLHRFLIPGIREGVKAEILARTPHRFVHYCQMVCLETASSICDLFSEVHELGASPWTNGASLAISLYQCAQVLDHLAFRMPTTGPHSLGEIKRKLTKGLKLAYLLGSKFKWLRSCVRQNSC